MLHIYDIIVIKALQTVYVMLHQFLMTLQNEILSTETSDFLKQIFFSQLLQSNSRNDVLRMAQRYETIAAHTRPRYVCSVFACTCTVLSF